MSALMDLIQSTIKDSSIDQISEQLGQDPQTASNAIDAALPMLIAALSNSARRDSAEGLTRAIETRHDGSILDDVSGYVAKNDLADGKGILGHILGPNENAAAQVLGSATGLDAGKAGSLMATLAPVLLGALGKAKNQQSLGADDLLGLLSDESESVKRRSPSMMTAIWGLLDTDGDGDTDFMDLVRAGSKGLDSILRK